MLSLRRAKNYLNAGYTHYAMYEVWLPLAGEWCDSGFPFVDEPNGFHREALKLREAKGEVRYVTILAIASLECE